MSTIALIGYRGTGKSEVSKQLGSLLQVEVISIDAEIVRAMGMLIPAIVEKHGWPYFRDVESAVLREFCARKDMVIDCGGGIIERNENRDLLKNSARVFWLQASPETIAARIRHDTNRPSLTGNKSHIDEIREVLAVREPLYRATAEAAIDGNAATPDQIARRIIELL